MAPPAKMRGDGRKAKNAKKTLFRLLSYMKKHIPTLVIVLAMKIQASTITRVGMCFFI